MQQLAEAAATVLTLHHFSFLLLGVVVGLIVAILPGLGGSAGLSLVLPFVFGMDQSAALAMMIGLLAITATGDTFPSVLMGIPGSSASQATVLDGFPLARQGKAAMALSAAFASSLLGGLVGAVVLTLAIFTAKPLIMAIGFGEQFLLVILALTMVGMLSGTNVLKGLAAAGIGLMIGAMGAAPATGQLRYAFSSVYLIDGLPLAVFSLGIFALPEIYSLLRDRGTIASSRLGEGWREGLAAVRRNFGLVLKCSGIGCLIGALPGLGGSVVDWVAYGHAVQTTRDNPRFGQGDIRGVIAPESANNAVRGGELIPTLFFGIPGSGSMALLLGGFILIGLQPGYRMISRDLDVTFSIIWSLALANVLGAVICIALARPISQLTRVPYGRIGPVILVIIVFTAYQSTRNWGDLVWLFLLGFVGLWMKRFEWSRPALVIGFVLSHDLESSFYRTAQVYGFDFLWRPQALVILGLLLLSLYLGFRVTQTSRSVRDHEGSAPSIRFPQLAFTVGAALLTAAAVVSMAGKAYLTALFPVTVGSITIILLVAVALRQIRAPLTDPVLSDAEQVARGTADAPPSSLRYVIWLGLLLAAVYLCGFTIGSVVFLLAFISIETNWRLFQALPMAAVTIGLLTLLAYELLLTYPEGLLPRYGGFPWWLQ